MCETTTTCLVEAVCVGVVLKDQTPEVFLLFRAVMFRLFTFDFAFAWVTFIAMVLRTKELIFYQFALSLLSNHFNAVSKTNFFSLRELIEHSNCQEVRSRSLITIFAFLLEHTLHIAESFWNSLLSLWCGASFALFFLVLTVAGVVMILK